MSSKFLPASLKTALLVLFCTCAVLAVMVHHGHAAAGRPRVVAIMAFEFLGEGPDAKISSNATSHRGRMVTEIFTTEAVRSSVFQVVERSVLENVLAEMEFGDTGLSGSAAQKIGRMVNADAVLSGAVSEYRGDLRIDARLINVADGRVILADKAFSKDTLPSISEAVEEVLEKMAEALAPASTPDPHSLTNASIKTPPGPARPALQPAPAPVPATPAAPSTAAAVPSPQESRPLPAASLAVSASSFEAPTQEASFEPGNVADGDPTTAWMEGGTDGGAGEWLKISFDAPVFVTEVQCVNGLAAPLLFQQYSRLKEVDVELSTGRTIRATLGDSFLWQPLVRVDEQVEWIKLQVVSVHPGRRWKRAALAEVEVSARP